MATSEQINRTIAALRSKSEAIYDVIALYLDPETTPEQRSAIRAGVKPMQSQVRFWGIDQRSLEERIRLHVASMSLFDGVENEAEDWRDASLAHDRFIKTVVDAALRSNVPVFQIIQEIRQISTPQANGKIAAFEELCRYRSREVHKEDAKRWRQEQSGTPAEQAPPTAGRDVAARAKAKRKSGLAGNFNTDLPRRYWVSPWLRFSIYVVIVSVMAIIVILSGEDPRPVIFVSLIFLGIVAALSWTYFNRDWGK